MPASRSARAITLAPRSCPSSPGFATNTRILRSAIVIHLTTEATGAHRGCVPLCPPWLEGLRIQTLPQIPTSHAAIRFPALCDLLHLLRARQFEPPLAALLGGRRLFRCLRPLHIEIVLVHRHAHAKIACRQYVLALQCEH